MRTLCSAETYLVASPKVNWPEVAAMLYAEYGHDMESGWKRGPADCDPESLCELMGRLCYGSFGPRQGRIGAAEYLNNILEHGHGSVLEHACWSFIVCRASRGYTHQMVRHRAGFSYSQESTHFVRYKSSEEGTTGQEPGICTVGVPEAALSAFLTSATAAFNTYEVAYTEARKTLNHKQACAAVRGLIPTATESRLGFTANARALRHFIELRGAYDNVPEIRVVAAQVARLLYIDAPAIFGDMGITKGEDGYPVVTSRWHKV